MHRLETYLEADQRLAASPQQMPTTSKCWLLVPRARWSDIKARVVMSLHGRAWSVVQSAQPLPRLTCQFCHFMHLGRRDSFRWCRVQPALLRVNDIGCRKGQSRIPMQGVNSVPRNTTVRSFDVSLRQAQSPGGRKQGILRFGLKPAPWIGEYYRYGPSCI